MPKRALVLRRLLVATYVGHQANSSGADYTAPNVQVLVQEDRGLRIALGTHDPEALQPDVQIERRPQGWALFLHPVGGSDPCAIVYFHDDGRSWLTKEAPGPTPDLVEADSLPPEIDA